MEEQIDEKLNDLLKYIPFIDFIVDLDKQKYEKFIDIRKWILTKKRFPLNDLNKIEKSIKTQFRNLTCSADKKIPPKILDIFRNEVCHQYIDLCSDDEANSFKGKNNSNNDDDLEIVYVSYPTKPKSKECKKKSDREYIAKGINANDHKKSEGVSSKKGLHALDDDASKLLNQIDRLSSEDKNYNNTTSYYDHDSSVVKKETFQRRKQNNDLFKRRERKQIFKIEPDTISLDSSDDEFSNKVEPLITNYNHVSLGKNHPSPSKENCLIVEEDNDILLTEMTENITESPKENLSPKSPETISKTNNVITNTTRPSNFEELLDKTPVKDEQKEGKIEKLLNQLITLLQKNTSERQDADETCPEAPSISMNVNTATHISPCNVPSNVPITPQQTYVGDYPTYYSQFQRMAYQRKLNLNDPRIRNELNKYKNSPLLIAGGIDITSLTNNTTEIPFCNQSAHCNYYPYPDVDNSPRHQFPMHCTQDRPYRPTAPNSCYRTPYRQTGPSLTKSSITYAEYKRRKAEEEERKAKREMECRQSTNVSNRVEFVNAILNNKNLSFPKDETDLLKSRKEERVSNTNSECNKLSSNDQEPKLTRCEENFKNNTPEKCKPSSPSLENKSDGMVQSKESLKSKKSSEFERILKEIDHIIPLKKRSSSVQARTEIIKQLETETLTPENNEISPKKLGTKSSKTPSKTNPSKNVEDAVLKVPNKRSKTMEDSSKPKPSKTKNLKRRKTIDDSTSVVGKSCENPPLKETKNSTPKSIIQNQPILMLKRLTESDISSYTTANKRSERSLHKLDEISSSDILNVELVQCGTRKLPRQPSETLPKSAKPKKPNNDLQMTAGSTRKCALCTTRPADLTNHYIRKHKTESYTSRLSLTRIEDLTSNIRFIQELQANIRNKRLSRFSVVCPFCDEELIDSFPNFYDHYATHTGEYAYQCSGCNFTKPFKADIQSHISHSKLCRTAYLQVMYRYPANAKVIYMHYCKICNFVQLNEANIFKHQREHHDPRQAVSDNVGKCILAAICEQTDDFSAPNLPANGSTEDDDIPEEDNEEEDEIIAPRILSDNIPVQNESFSEENYNSSLRTLEEALKEMHEGIQKNTTTMPELAMTTIHDFPTKVVGPENSTAMTPKQESSFEEPAPNDFIMNICKSEPNYDEQFIAPSFPNSNLHVHQYRHYPQNIQYFGLFKCLADDCYFSSNSCGEYIEHIEAHYCDDNEEGAKEREGQQPLCCPYCSQDSSSSMMTPHQMAEHISRDHHNLIFQCSICCYRSCDASNVAIHQTEMHASHPTCVVYKCLDMEITPDQEYLKKKISENVGKVECAYCNEEAFYHSNLLEHHLAVVHNISITKILEYYSCIYCPTHTNEDRNVMRKHLALQHPEEFPFLCDHNEIVVNLNEDVITNLKLVDVSEKIPVVDVNSNTAASQDSGADVKPNIEEILKLQEETLKIRLNKLTRYTGIAPDCLYHCPIQTCARFFSTFDMWLRHMRLRHMCLECECPHCPNKNGSTLRALPDYEKHFEEHRRHTYVCYHCISTFPSYQEIQKHVQDQHGSEVHCEKVRFNFNYAYHIAIQSNLILGPSEFLINCLSRLEDGIKQMELKESTKLKKEWLIDYQRVMPSWVDECAIDLCSVSKLSICGVCCKAFGSQLQLSEHIKANHARRDAHVINIERQKDQNLYLNLALVFATDHISFATMTNCFCCEERNIEAGLFILHLKNYHKFVLNYYCEYCQKQMESIKHATGHFKEHHADTKIKIRCELLSEHEITLISIRNFKIQIENNRRSAADFIVKEELFDSERCGESHANDVMLLDEDDVIVENFEKELRNNKDIKNNKPKLKCIAMDNLLESKCQSAWSSYNVYEDTSKCINTAEETKNALIYYNAVSQQQIFTTLPALTTPPEYIPSALPCLLSYNVPQQVAVANLNNNTILLQNPPPSGVVSSHCPLTYLSSQNTGTNCLPPFWN